MALNMAGSDLTVVARPTCCQELNSQVVPNPVQCWVRDWSRTGIWSRTSPERSGTKSQMCPLLTEYSSIFDYTKTVREVITFAFKCVPKRQNRRYIQWVGGTITFLVPDLSGLVRDHSMVPDPALPGVWDRRCIRIIGARYRNIMPF